MYKGKTVTSTEVIPIVTKWLENVLPINSLPYKLEITRDASSIQVCSYLMEEEVNEEEDDLAHLQLLESCVSYRRSLYQSVGADPGSRFDGEMAEIDRLKARIASRTGC
jgi:hypothetical protein